MPFTPEEQMQTDNILDALEDPSTDPAVVTALLDMNDAIIAQADMRDAEEFDATIDRAPRPGKPVVAALPEDHNLNFSGRIPMDSLTKVHDEETKTRNSLNDAAASGVDVTTGSSSKLRTIASAADLDKGAQAGVLDYLFRKELIDKGVKVPENASVVSIDPHTGQLQYLRASKDGSLVQTLVDPEGFQFADLADMVGTSGQILTEGGGAVAGVAAAGALFFGVGGTGALAANTLAAAGAAAGASLALSARRAVLEEVGVPEELIKSAVDDHKTEQLLWAFGGQAAVPLLMGAARAWRNIPRFLDENTPQAAKDKIRATIKKTGAALDRLRQQGIDISMTVGERTQDPIQAVIESRVKADAMNDKSLRIKVRDMQQEKNLVEALDELANDVTVNRPTLVDPLKGKDGTVVGAMTDAVRTLGVGAERLAAVAATTLTTMAKRIDGGFENTVFTRVQEEVLKNAKTAGEREGAAWSTFREAAGWNGSNSDLQLVNSADSPIRKFLTELSKREAGAILPSSGKWDRAFLKDAGMDSADKTHTPISLNAETLGMEELHVVLSNLHSKRAKLEVHADAGEGYSLNTVNGLITAIKGFIHDGDIRKISTGQTLNPAGKEASQVKAAWQAANDTTVMRQKVFREKLILDMLKKDHKGIFDQGPEVVQDVLFKKRDAFALRKALDGVGVNIAIKGDMSKVLYGMYHRQVLTLPGSAQKEAQTKFMENYGAHTRVLFGEEAASEIVHVGDMIDKINAADDLVETTWDMLERAFGKELVDKDFNPGNLAEYMLKMKPRKIRDTMKALAVTPGLKEDVQKEVLALMKLDMTKSGGNALDGSHLDKLLTGTDRPAILRELLGKEYLQNVTDLHTVLGGFDYVKHSDAYRKDSQNPFVRITRTFWGALSSFQRRVTAGLHVSRGLRNSQQVNALLDPNAINSWMLLKSKSATHDALMGAFVNIFGKAAAATLLNDSPELLYHVQRDAQRRENKKKHQQRQIERQQSIQQRRPAAGQPTAMAQERHRRGVPA